MLKVHCDVLNPASGQARRARQQHHRRGNPAAAPATPDRVACAAFDAQNSSASSSKGCCHADVILRAGPCCGFAYRAGGSGEKYEPRRMDRQGRAALESYSGSIRRGGCRSATDNLSRRREHRDPALSRQALHAGADRLQPGQGVSLIGFCRERASGVPTSAGRAPHRGSIGLSPASRSRGSRPPTAISSRRRHAGGPRRRPVFGARSMASCFTPGGAASCRWRS